MTPHVRLTFAFLSVMLACPAFAQQAGKQAAAPAPAPLRQEPKPSDILQDRPDLDIDPDFDRLGQPFRSKGHGIALRPPKDMTPVKRVGANDIIEFVNEAKGWTLKLSKMKLSTPGSLTEWRDQQGQLQPGVLEFTVTRLKEEIPDAEILRQEKINIGDGDVGMIALRYTRNLKSLLSQQAIIQRTRSTYYLLALTTPGAARGSKEEQAATSEREAVEAFRQVLDSVELLDQDDVVKDQTERLFRTRGLLVNFTGDRLRSALKEQQWMRILKNGKDIGYTYLEEKTEIKGAQDGVEIRLRSRVLPGNGVQVDVGSIMFASMDLRHEDWSTLTEQADIKQRAANKDYKPPQITEFGISDRRVTPGQGDEYTLQVLFESTAGDRVDPVLRPLAPWYLPQAVSHLLPRLLPISPKTYVFAVYVPDTREVVMRYVDVLPPQQVTLDNKLVRAHPVQDRLGIEGSITTHYLTSDRQWLGSENKDTRITILPTDEETLLKLWTDADLTRPENPAPRAAKVQAAAGQEDGNVRKPRQPKGSGAPAGGKRAPAISK